MRILSYTNREHGMFYKEPLKLKGQRVWGFKAPKGYKHCTREMLTTRVHGGVRMNANTRCCWAPWSKWRTGLGFMGGLKVTKAKATDLLGGLNKRWFNSIFGFFWGLHGLSWHLNHFSSQTKRCQYFYIRTVNTVMFTRNPPLEKRKAKRFGFWWTKKIQALHKRRY